jgi:hypothetical protein
MKPYKLQLVQALKPDDLAIRYEFYREILARTDLPARFIFSDEAALHINGKVNRHTSVFGEQKILMSPSSTKEIRQK